MNCDPIRDLLQRLLEAAQRDGGFTDALAREVEAQFRQDWGGDRVYIAKTGEDARLEMNRRNAAIINDLNNGERVAFVSRRHRISRRRVYQIWDAYLASRRRQV